ncbi:hypothetical protein H920_18954 [Fukomys damarensis]|uniref:Uncharacterized protein n=1 Tax=Fukomys damarensis TaxID=885580 RepID=A0A091CPT0_FUKDA|nr:hypothetical protein H920_18954 [Fukomys damarensis]
MWAPAELSTALLPGVDSEPKGKGSAPAKPAKVTKDPLRSLLPGLKVDAIINYRQWLQPCGVITTITQASALTNLNQCSDSESIDHYPNYSSPPACVCFLPLRDARPFAEIAIFTMRSRMV